MRAPQNSKSECEIRPLNLMNLLIPAMKNRPKSMLLMGKKIADDGAFWLKKSKIAMN